MRKGFTVLEVLIALVIALILWETIMVMMKAEAKMREGVDERLTAENIPAVLHRHLSRDLSRVPLVSGAEAVKLTDGGATLALTVQVAPATLADRKLDLPVRTVRYAMSGAGAVARDDAGQKEQLPVDGLVRLKFAREPAVEEGQQDMLRVTGAVEGHGGAPPAEFSLAFPVGARKAGAVRWASLLKPQPR